MERAGFSGRKKGLLSLSICSVPGDKKAHWKWPEDRSGPSRADENLEVMDMAEGDLEQQKDPEHNHPDLQWSHLGPMNSSKQNKKTSGRGERRLRRPRSLSEVTGHEVQTSRLIGQLYW